MFVQNYLQKINHLSYMDQNSVVNHFVWDSRMSEMGRKIFVIWEKIRKKGEKRGLDF